MRVKTIIKTRAKFSEVIAREEYLEVRVKALPVEGNANEEARQLVARYLRVAPSTLRLIRGQKSKQKIFEY